ncbi:hypothetical protein CV102_24235 [Natronococcus pandeyae]|uniref:Uncharacterized protein n=1 Tax=Natronococcus pandeyae TaxID=2055836 RepID=A0A8J8TNC0_9EURY|nr:hypothetical protein CV102_24235 [Natronococcus pandeyae]
MATLRELGYVRRIGRPDIYPTITTQFRLATCERNPMIRLQNKLVFKDIVAPADETWTRKSS